MNLPKYLYHATCSDNFESILKDKILVGKGGRISGPDDEDVISLSDIKDNFLSLPDRIEVVRKYKRRIKIIAPSS